MTHVRPHPLLWSTLAAVLLVPLIAMQFTTEVRWDETDFLVMGALLASCGVAWELLARRSAGLAYRAASGLAVLTGLLLVWVNLAVGIVGSENNDANLLFVGVIAVAIGGAFVGRWEATGMARAMFVAAAAQGMVGAIAIAFGLGADGIAWPRDVIGATLFFCVLWLVAGGLFRVAARTRS